MRVFVKCGSKEPFSGRIAQDPYSSRDPPLHRALFHKRTLFWQGFSLFWQQQAAASCSKLQHTAIISLLMQRSFAKIQEIDKIAAALNEYRIDIKKCLKEL